MWNRAFRPWFQFSPDDQSAAANGSAPSNQLQAAAAAAESAPSPSTPPPTAAAPSNDTQASQGPPPLSGLREALSPHFGDQALSQFQDDQTLLSHLVSAYQQAQNANRLAPYGEMYLQHADKFQSWLKQEQEREQAAQAQQQSWWKAPEYNPAWINMVEKDEQGNLRAKPGYPPDIPQKLLTALDHQKTFLNDFSFNPIEKLKPGIMEIAKQVAQEMVQQHLGGYQEEVFANNFVQQNSAWLHQRDQAGNVLFDQRTGKPALTAEGQRFARYANQAQQMGISNVEAQRDYAFGMTQRDIALAQLQAGGNAANGQAANRRFLDQRNPNQSGVQPANGQKPAKPPIGTGARNLSRRMMEAMQEEGIQPGQKLIR